MWDDLRSAWGVMRSYYSYRRVGRRLEHDLILRSGLDWTVIMPATQEVGHTLVDHYHLIARFEHLDGHAVAVSARLTIRALRENYERALSDVVAYATSAYRRWYEEDNDE